MKDYCEKCDRLKEGEYDNETGRFYCHNCGGLREMAIQNELANDYEYERYLQTPEGSEHY